MTTPTFDNFWDKLSRGDVEDNMPNPQYRAKLALHPNCRDPEHPGCEKCEDPETGEPLVDTSISDDTPTVEIAVADVKKLVKNLDYLLSRIAIDECVDSSEVEPLRELLASLVYDATGEEL